MAKTPFFLDCPGGITQRGLVVLRWKATITSRWEKLSIPDRPASKAGSISIIPSAVGRSLTKSLGDGFQRPVRSPQQPDGRIGNDGLHNFDQSCLYYPSN